MSFALPRCLSRRAVRLRLHGARSPRSAQSTQYRPVTTIASCPPPTCPCQATPAMPDGLEIDRAAVLAGKMPLYNQHVLVASGRSDWSSKAEQDVPALAGLRALVLGRGAFSDPRNPLLLSATSSAGPPPPRLSALLFPSFLRVESVLSSAHHDLSSTLESFARTFLLAASPPSPSSSSFTATPIRHATILVCTHGGRDARCGTLGPVLAAEFRAQLPRFGAAPSSAVECVSHIGGHAVAGNVIVYIPPGLRTDGGAALHPLAGQGVWYGRVEPRHVEGIVRETVGAGRVIEELLRGRTAFSGGQMPLVDNALAASVRPGGGQG